MQADDFLLVGVGCTHTMHHTHNHPPLKKLLCRRPPPSIRAQKAKQAGDFLLVGVHTDEDVTERRGPHLPIMGLHERALSVLSCRYVDEVVIGEPLGLSPVHFACREGRCCEDVHPTNCSAHSGSVHAIAHPNELLSLPLGFPCSLPPPRRPHGDHRGPADHLQHLPGAVLVA